MIVFVSFRVILTVSALQGLYLLVYYPCAYYTGKERIIVGM